MTNQPKFAKFVATAATATLVASAIVPVASAAGFSDVADTNSHAENINALVEAGLINGYQDGTFRPNAELTRGHVVKMLGRWVEAQGKEIPADWNTVQRFDDVAVNAADEELVKYAALVKDAGVFNGSNGDLNAAASISRENMALVLDRAYNAIFGKSLVDLAVGSENVTVADLSTAKAEAQEAIQALRNLGISNVDSFQPKNTVTRAQFASFLNRTINAKGEVVAATAIKSLTATGKSQLTVVFDGPVNTEAATFKVAKGSAEVAVADIDWNEDKTEAVLTVGETFGGATYTVTVGGVAGQDLTATVATAREQVTSVEFLSDYLVFTGKEDKATDGKEYKQAVITFAVYNQYGEDITDDVNESYFKELDVSGIDIYDEVANAGDIQAPKIDDGKFIVWVDEDEDDDATGTVEMTYERNDYEFDVKHDVTLSDEAEPSQVEIVDVYSPTNDELTVENLENNKKDFYILFNVKDQFGVQIDAKFADKIKSATQDTILTEVQDGIRVDASDDDIFEVADEDQIEVINVDGKYYFAIKIFNEENEVKGGDNTVTFRSTATGEEASKVINVSDSAEAYSIELGLPDEVLAGDETVKLPVFVYNKAGELLVDAKALNEDVRENRIKVDLDGAAQNDRYTFIEEDGKVFLKFDTKSNLKDEAEEYDFSIEVEESGVENKVTAFVEPDAHPEKIVGLKDKALQYALKGDQIVIAPEDLIIEDQYGRSYDDKSGDASFFKVNVTSSNGTFNVESNPFAAGETGDIVLTSTGKGNATVTFELEATEVQNNKTTPITDKLDLTFRSLEAGDFDSFKVESDGVLRYDLNNKENAADDAGIEVYGLVGNLEVEIHNTDNAFDMALDSKYLKFASEDNAVVVNTEFIGEEIKEKSDKVNADVLVTINETGETIRHSLTIQAEDSKVEKKYELVDNDSLAKALVDDVEITVTDSSLTAEDIFAALAEAGTWDIEDQYDEDAIKVSETGEVTFQDGNSDKINLTVTEINAINDKGVVKNNGTNTASITLGENGLEAGDSFDLTLTIDGKSQTVKVYLVAPISEEN